jgi:predicted SnoaL-like aldol condensation-catalyzing enzyme
MDNKARASSFLQLTASGHAHEGFAQYAAPHFRHHNPWFKGDAASLAAGMDDNYRQFPGKTCEVKRAVAEGDLVVLHAHVHFKPGDTGYAVVHIYRFEAGRIAELWDLGMELPAESPNANGVF